MDWRWARSCIGGISKGGLRVLRVGGKRRLFTAFGDVHMLSRFGTTSKNTPTPLSLALP
jgi:hypothetical protein